MKSFVDWLRESGLERYAAAFAENDIDFRNAPTLSEADLKELGLTLGHRKNFLAALAALEASIPARPADLAAAAPVQVSDWARHHRRAHRCRAPEQGRRAASAHRVVLRHGGVYRACVSR